MKALAFLAAAACSVPAYAQFRGIPASDTMGADDLAHNPTFVGGVANGGSTAHGVW